MKKSILKNIILLLPLVALVFQAPAVPLARADLSRQAQLEQQLQDIENQIAQLETQLQSATAEKNTIVAKVQQLKTQQQQITLQIQQTSYLIGDLGDQIGQTQQAINQSEAKIDLLKAQISETLLQIYQRDNVSLAASLAGNNGLIGFFQEVDNFQALNQSLGDSLQEVNALKSNLESQQQQLSDQQQSAEGLQQLQAKQQQDLNTKLSAQNDLLKQSQSKQSQVTVVLNYNKQIAAQIRSQIYQLLGVTTRVTFGQALDIARTVSASTGIRPAYLLAVLTQESNLGKNVGTCNRPGDPPSKSWKVIMKPDRDQQPFIQITGDLGLDPNNTPVSCPAYSRSGQRLGWGGAMGPAQFIPSTWVGYAAKVAAITGHPANPFDITDAFYAAAIKLVADGAASGGTQGEYNAALRYYSGSTNSKYSFYGKSVAAIAQQYQNNIDSLANSGS